jgi:hypothetical protein
MKIKKIDTEDIIDIINGHQWIKYLLYGGCAVVGIWVIGKASK